MAGMMNRESLSAVTIGAPLHAGSGAERASTEPDAASERRPSHWRVEALDFAAIDPARIAAREDLFYLLVSASFIESGSDLYTRNLSDHYVDYPEVAAWLREHWEHEELRHGRAFECYV